MPWGRVTSEQAMPDAGATGLKVGASDGLSCEIRVMAFALKMEVTQRSNVKANALFAPLYMSGRLQGSTLVGGHEVPQFFTMNRVATWRTSKALSMSVTSLHTPFVQQSARAELLVFDWDGTLFDSTAIIARCIQLAVRDVGGDEPSFEQASHVIGLGLLHALRLAAPDVKPDEYPELARRYGHHYDLHADDLSLFPGTLEMLTDLKTKGYRLAIATGKSRKGLDHILGRLPVEGLFVASRTADQTQGKPDPTMLLELMEECRVTASHTVMVGDTSHDLQMALNAGCRSVGVSYGAHPVAQLEMLKPLFVAHNTQALHEGLLTHTGLSHEQL